MPLTLRIYVGSLTLAAGLGLVLDPLSWVSHATSWQLILFVALVVLCAAGEHISFRVHSGWAMHAGTVPHLATALLLPPGPAGLVAGLGMLVYVVNRRLTLPKAI